MLLYHDELVSIWLIKHQFMTRQNYTLQLWQKLFPFKNDISSYVVQRCVGQAGTHFQFSIQLCRIGWYTSLVQYTVVQDRLVHISSLVHSCVGQAGTHLQFSIQLCCIGWYTSLVLYTVVQDRQLHIAYSQSWIKSYPFTFIILQFLVNSKSRETSETGPP